MKHHLTVVKVGGSILDQPDHLPRLQAWLSRLSSQAVLIAGGGRQVDLLRQQSIHDRVDSERAHWNAIRLMDGNTGSLAIRLPGTVRIDHPSLIENEKLLNTCLAVAPLLLQDLGSSHELPQTWEVTSDSIAARVAEVLDSELVLLKSCPVPEPPYDWQKLSREGIVDAWFPQIAPQVKKITLVQLP